MLEHVYEALVIERPAWINIAANVKSAISSPEQDS
jgi:hypothetical protein